MDEKKTKEKEFSGEVASETNDGTPLNNFLQDEIKRVIEEEKITRITFEGKTSEKAFEYLTKKHKKRWSLFFALFIIGYILYLVVALTTKIMKGMFGPMMWAILIIGGLFFAILPIIIFKKPYNIKRFQIIKDEIFITYPKNQENFKKHHITKVEDLGEFYYINGKNLADGIVVDKKNIKEGNEEEFNEYFKYLINKSNNKVKNDKQ